MQRSITMSVKEVDQIEIFEKLQKREISQKDAAKRLDLSIRQIKRKLRAYKIHGPKSLVHQSRGKVSNRKTDQSVLDNAMDTIREKYSGFGPTLSHEKLVEDHEFTGSLSLIRSQMIKEDLWKPKTRRKASVHQLRERRACFGELVQLDGSPHDWFEGRGDKCNLNVSVDDATGNTHCLFSKVETTQDYFKLVEAYLLKYGKPVAFYVDKHSIFRVNTISNPDFKKPKKYDEYEGLTQFGRAMSELGIELIFANTPQAKGRVERVNQTLQDRLVKEMRLNNISTTNEANLFLPQFMNKFNHKFCVEPRSKVDVHTKLSRDLDLSKILCIKEKRILSKNLNFQYGNTVFQINTNRSVYSLRKTAVTICQKYDSSITLWDHKGKPLDYTTIKKLPHNKTTSSKQLNHRVDDILAKRMKSPWDSDLNQFEQENLFQKPSGVV